MAKQKQDKPFAREGSFIRSARRDRNHSAKYISSKLGMSESMLYKYESGIRKMPDELLITICGIFDIDPLEVRPSIADFYMSPKPIDYNHEIRQLGLGQKAIINMMLSMLKSRRQDKPPK